MRAPSPGKRWKPRVPWTGTPPCAGSAAWDVDPPRGGYTTAHRAALDNAATLLACRGCPIRVACHDTWAAGIRNHHHTADVVAGGVVWVDGRRVAGIGDLQAPPVTLRPSRRIVEPCGTRATYRRHIRRGEHACDTCCAAERARKTAPTPDRT